MKLRLLIVTLFTLFCIVFIIENNSVELFRWFCAVVSVMSITAMYYAHHKERLEKSEQAKGLIMEETNKKMETINQAKNEFLSFATHQLRSPLTSIKWGLNAISDSVKNDASTLQMVEQLRTIADNMVTTISDLLDISKIEQGGLILTTESVDLVELLDQLAEDFRMTAGAKSLLLQFKTDLPIAIISGDKTKLRQVFSNLIDNAIKYTSSGSITISLSYQNNGNQFIISVTDTGPGIEKEELTNLFEKFARGTAGKASATKGSGLGLYLGKRIVELHKGTIDVSSAGKDKGSTFSVHLPKNI